MSCNDKIEIRVLEYDVPMPRNRQYPNGVIYYKFYVVYLDPKKCGQSTAQSMSCLKACVEGKLFKAPRFQPTVYVYLCGDATIPDTIATQGLENEQYTMDESSLMVVLTQHMKCAKPLSTTKHVCNWDS